MTTTNKHYVYAGNELYLTTSDHNEAEQKCLELIAGGHTVSMKSYFTREYRVLLQRLDQRTVTVEAGSMDEAEALAGKKIGDDDLDEWNVIDVSSIP